MLLLLMQSILTTLAIASKDQKRALEEAVWRCQKMKSLFDEGVTLNEIIPAISRAQYKNLEEETVIAAIASMWRALLPHVPYSFHSASFFRQDRSKKARPHVMPSSKAFIIPLLFTAQTFADAAKHLIEEQWVLAVATHDSPDAQVSLDFFYHRPSLSNVPESDQIGELTDKQIREAAQHAVQTAGWLSKRPSFSKQKETWHPVCESIANKGGTLSSGHLVVLTAWMYMLGLPVPEQMKPGVRPKEDVCRGIQRLVVMALDGRLTPQVVDLFTQAHFAAKELTETQVRDLDASRAKLKKVRTYTMNTKVLDQTLDVLRKDPTCLDKIPQQAEPTTSRQSSHNRVISSHGRDKQTTNRPPSQSFLKRDKLYWQTTHDSWMKTNQKAIRKCIRDNSGKPSWARVGDYLKDPTAYEAYELTDDQVFGSIGALWRARWESSKRKRLGFGDANAFQFHRFLGADDGSTGMVGGSAATSPHGRMLPLMIPLCGDHSKEFKHGNGHWVFLVARQARGNGRQIRLHLWNSAEGLRQRNGIVAEAKGLVERCGWLRDIDPIWKEVDVMPCPEQRVLNSCGVYVVLNAWCYQLGLTPPAKRLFLNDDEKDEAFIRTANLMINLTLHGEMDSDGIRAFLMAYGYCSPRDMRKRQTGGNLRCVKVGMECAALTRFIRRVRQEERGEKVSPASDRRTRSSN